MAKRKNVSESDTEASKQAANTTKSDPHAGEQSAMQDHGSSEAQAQAQAQPESVSKGPHWISALHEHWAAGKDWVLVTGYEGGVVENEMMRLFLDPMLWQAIDVPRDAILHRERIRGGLEGATQVWVDRTQWCNCIYRQRG